MNKNTWIAPCVAIAGMTNVGSGSFIGINAAIGNNLSIAPETIIGAGTVVHKTIERSGVYVGNPARLLNHDVAQYFTV